MKPGFAIPLVLAGALVMNAQTSFDALVDRYFEDYFRLHPSSATGIGFHQYDAQLEDVSEAAIQQESAMGRKYLAEFEKQPPSVDRDLIISRIKARLLDDEVIRPWEKNPDTYSSNLAGSVFGLMSRKFAPPEDRLRSVIAREKLMPQVFKQARKNLKNPPRIYTEIALEQLPGITNFFAKDVPKAFTAVKDQALLAEFKQSTQEVVDALKDYEAYLQKEVLPKSKGDFRIGTENYRKKLLYEEMVDVPLDRLLKIGYEDLRRNQKAFLETAAKIDAKRKPLDIFHDLEKEHPAPDQLLQTFRDTLGGLEDFIHEHKIITILSQQPPTLEETPPFMRATTFASMDTPGPYEKVAKEAFFNVTLPEQKWTKEQVAEHMASFNRGTIISTAIHEAYPGHYVQLLWFQRVKSKPRKILMSNSNVEGWAHYTEQMMLDEGYGNGDLKLRLGQLQDALLRDCRYIVGIRMHTGKMTYDQGLQFFMKEGYMTRVNAERETKRGTGDPTYLVYTLGKLEILKLREDYQKKLGKDFSLLKFHDTFMQQGGVPVKLIRQAMLGDDSPTL